MDKADRYNEGKLKYDLLPPEWLEALAGVSTHGATKYAPRNWEKGDNYSTYIGCAYRHIEKYRKGETYDDESGYHHLGHAAWNLLALLYFDMKGLGVDDLTTLPNDKPLREEKKS